MELDILLRNARIIDVAGGTVRPGQVGVLDGRIALILDNKEKSPHSACEIDAEEAFVAPGFFDAHAHADLFFNPAAFSDGFLVRGVTGVFADNHDCAVALGPCAYEKLLDAARYFNIRFFAGVPAAAPLYPAVEGPELWSEEDFARLIARPEVLSISEIQAWPSVLDGDRRLISRIRLAHSLGKRVEGHTVGASAAKLKDLAEAGLTSCHEALSPQDVRNRLDAGLWVMVRHSSIRTDLDRIVPYLTGLPEKDLDRVCLVTDGVFARDCLEVGALENTVVKALELGLAPMQALKMVTLNPARYFGLDGRLGQIKTGLAADLVMFRELERPRPELVICRGRLAARDGRLLLAPSTCPALGLGDRPFTLPLPGPEAFELRTQEHSPVTVPVIRVVDQTVTAAEEAVLPVVDGRLVIPDEPDLMRAALLTRDGAQTGLGLVRNLGFRVGGLASSVAHETHGLMVLGSSPRDMSLALASLKEMNGGLTVWDSGRELLRIPLPLGGIMADLSLAETAATMDKLDSLLRGKGSPWPGPLLPVVFLSFTSILRLRLTCTGVYDVRTGRVVFNGFTG